ncbi:MAG TPA: hypothetical protein VE221_06110 [Sphingomicrobium sp.]|jgi:hypothetical protein|nr:hypothetical protein [Sphingomicrobium sp.]
MASDKKELFDFLDRRAFKPVLDADLKDYSGDGKRKLADAQQATRSERERYKHYDSADELYRMFHDDLSSEPAKKVHRELTELGLPTLNDVRKEFDERAKEAGVHG